jgi:hypothetical protein
MNTYSLRRLRPPVTRWSHRLAGRDGRAATERRAADFDEAKAQALCDLVADPSTGIVRVTLVGAGPGLLEAIEDVAAGRGVALHEERRTGGGHATLERECRPSGKSESW